MVWEPHFVTDAGLRKPDLLVVRGDEAHILDVQVMNNDKAYLESYHRNKVNYYGSNKSLVALIKEKFKVGRVSTHALTISRKGL